MNRTRVTIAVLVLTSLPTVAQSQERTVVPGPTYEAGGFARFWLGDGWRSLWLTPITVPVLDLRTFAGGLEPERQGGGNQSVTLHMVDASGVGWIFRSIDKFPEQGLPRELNGSFLGGLIEDQISSLHPASHVIMPRLLEAAGILHLEPALYVMPDDPRLGEFRETFAGMLGEVELKPNEGPDDTPGFAGSTKIKDAEDVLDDLEESRGYRVDAEEFLRARLIDLWVGDPDRGSDQWRFARFGEEGDEVYRPIPRDRDWAFVHADGFLTARFRSFYPKLVELRDDPGDRAPHLQQSPPRSTAAHCPYARRLCECCPHGAADDDGCSHRRGTLEHAARVPAARGRRDEGEADRTARTAARDRGRFLRVARY